MLLSPSVGRRRNCRYRFSLHPSYSWRSLHVRDNNKSSQPGTISNRDRPRNRYHLYYYLLISILTIGLPSYAEEGETKNVSNPVAAATGNVTNQAVQFQNNGAPSRQSYGANISCNGATMTFSPFYMGNHVKPEIPLNPEAYVKNENWGGQINFMVPLDGGIVERCKAAADRQIEKMQLNYELVRIDNCAKLQQKGFMLRPGSRVYHICQDVIPIATYTKQIEAAKVCNTPPKPWYKPWYKPKPKCEMSTFTRKIGLPDPDLSDKVPEVKTSLVQEREAKPKATKKTTKTTTKK